MVQIHGGYREYAEKAINGICDKYLNIKDGEMSLGGICLVAGLGGKGNRPGTYDYYMSEPIVEDDAKGIILEDTREGVRWKRA